MIYLDFQKAMDKVSHRRLLNKSPWHGCAAKFCPNSIYKFADNNTTLIARISTNHETEYRKEIACSVAWCKDNNLSSHTSKMTELVIDFRKQD
eukprot:g29110.t1